MAIGMAVDSGKREVKQDLAADLHAAAEKAAKLNLWVEGKPFDFTLRQIAIQLEG